MGTNSLKGSLRDYIDEVYDDNDDDDDNNNDVDDVDEESRGGGGVTVRCPPSNR